MVYVGLFAGSPPCLAEVSDWLAVAVKNELSEAIRAIPILKHLSGAAPLDDGAQLTLKWHGFRPPTLGVFRLKVNHILANVRPASDSMEPLRQPVRKPNLPKSCRYSGRCATTASKSAVSKNPWRSLPTSDNRGMNGACDSCLFLIATLNAWPSNCV